MNAEKWPKAVAPLTAEQRRVSDDFVHYWHEVLPRKYGIVDRFNHRYVVKHAPREFLRTLEIGAGTGEHLKYETLSGSQEENYVALDIRENMAADIRKHFPRVQTVVGDCQQRLRFSDGYFDRILAIHVLEHLPNLPAAVREMYRLTNAGHGVVSIVIPCEGGLAYSLSRKVSAQRIFERRYNQPYNWFISREHLNRPNEIFEELAPYFEPVHRTYFPLRLPLVASNLCIGATFIPRRARRVV